MNKLNRKKIGDIMRFKRGYDLPIQDRIDGSFPVISSGGITGYHNLFKSKGEGVIIGRVGTLGDVYYYNGKFWPHNNSLYIYDFKENYPKYVYYLIKCLGNLSISGTSTVPAINRNVLHEIVLPFIELPLQYKVADCLYSIDSKIEVNNKINQELEAIAKTLYNYWFVQFDFPDANGKPYKTSGGKMVFNDELKREIPEGWEVEKLSSSSQIIDCLHSKKSDYLFENKECYLLQLENIKKDGLIDLTKKYYVSKDEYKRWTTRIEVQDSDLVITNAGRVAGLSQIPKNVKAGIGRNITAIRPSTIQPTFLYYTFQGAEMERQIKLNTDKGAFFKSLNVRGIKELFVVRPTKTLEDKFENIALKHRRKRESNSIQNQKLTELRDWLLPMLMNGQVRVGKVERELSVVGEEREEYKN